MQIAESPFPPPLPRQEASAQAPPPPPFGLAQPLSPVLEPAPEQMQYSPFLGHQYEDLRLQPLPSSPGPRAPALPVHLQQQQQPPPPPPPPPPQAGAAPAPLRFPYQTCELPGAASPEPDYPLPCQYPMDGAAPSGLPAQDCPRSSGLQEATSSYDPLALAEFPGLFDCEMLEAVDPQHGGYVLVN